MSIFPLRIALFSGNYNYQADGANKALNRLVSHLEKRGHEVLVFSPTSSEPDFEPAGTLISVPSIPIPGRGEYRLGMSLTGSLRRKISEFDPHIIHLSAPDILGHSALKYAEKTFRPAVASFHTRFDTYFKYYNLDVLAPPCRNLMTKFYARCKHVYVPSPSIGTQLQEDKIIDDNLRYWGRGIERAKFNPSYRDIQWRSDNGVKDDAIVIGFVGRLVKEKGLIEYAELIKALEARNMPICPVVVGDGPEFESVTASLPQAVMTGHLGGDDLSKAYANFDIFVNPSLTETFGNVTLEAMASGVPALCVNATGSADLVEDGVTGFLVDHASDADWVNKAEVLCRDEPLRAMMGAKAREASLAYDWDVILDHVVSQYYEVIAEYRPDHETRLAG